MNDLERKVTEFLKDDAAGARRPAQMPDGMTKHIRRHQTRTALVTGVVTIAVVAVSVAGFRAFLPVAADKQLPAGPGFGGASATTASLSYATVTYPSDWHLVEYQGAASWSDAAVQRGTGQAPILMLTNYAPQSTSRGGIDCPGPGDFPAGGVGVIVGATPGIANYGSNELPKAVRVFDRTTCTVGDGLQFTKWSQDGVDYLAAAWADDGASQIDVDTIQAAFQSLSFPASPPDAADASLTSPADVLFAGGTGRDAWRIVSYPSEQGETTMEMRTGETVNSATSISGTPIDIRDGEAVRLELAFPRWLKAGGGPSGAEDLGPAVLYGVTMRGIETIEIRNGSDPRLPAQRRPLPSYGKGWDAFAIPMDAVPLGGSVVALDASGNVVLDVKLDSLAVFSSTTSFTSDDPEGMAHMALLAADTWFADHGTYEGFTVQEASKIDPSLSWTDPTMNLRGDTVDITAVTSDSILLNTYPKDYRSAFFCAAHTPDGIFVESVQALEIGDCTPDGAAHLRLLHALAAATKTPNDSGTYEGLTPEKIAAFDPSITFNTSPHAKEGEVSVRDVSAATILLVTRASDGSVFCIADTAGGQGYGTTDASAVAECNLDSWPGHQPPEA